MSSLPPPPPGLPAGSGAAARFRLFQKNQIATAAPTTPMKIRLPRRIHVLVPCRPSRLGLNHASIWNPSMIPAVTITTWRI